MGKIMCLCRQVVWDGQSPCPYEWKFLADAILERWSGIVDSEDIYTAGARATLCPRCKRLHLWVKGKGAPAIIYRPSSEQDLLEDGPSPEPDDTLPSSWAELYS